MLAKWGQKYIKSKYVIQDFWNSYFKEKRSENMRKRVGSGTSLMKTSKRSIRKNEFFKRKKNLGETIFMDHLIECNKKKNKINALKKKYENHFENKSIAKRTHKKVSSMRYIKSNNFLGGSDRIRQMKNKLLSKINNNK